ncbi:hypothetical protein RchiOBHm_Chr2g0165091 [Rosa chinensis]|uniref:Uncharacterized protein n=1 Tax=Rosa chinensis TaxID=74649 RepID=A0A2P6S3R2_ROSCH|nr:hypothetical protein RchiOBHm_Chr2g0165091 [Rosa chinensis]
MPVVGRRSLLNPSSNFPAAAVILDYPSRCSIDRPGRSRLKHRIFKLEPKDDFQYTIMYSLE